MCIRDRLQGARGLRGGVDGAQLLGATQVELAAVGDPDHAPVLVHDLPRPQPAAGAFHSGVTVWVLPAPPAALAMSVEEHQVSGR
eukprot:4408605-Alexandrium_andersonii.AAC.1